MFDLLQRSKFLGSPNTPAGAFLHVCSARSAPIELARGASSVHHHSCRCCNHVGQRARCLELDIPQNQNGSGHGADNSARCSPPRGPQVFTCRSSGHKQEKRCGRGRGWHSGGTGSSCTCAEPCWLHFHWSGSELVGRIQYIVVRWGCASRSAVAPSFRIHYESLCIARCKIRVTIQFGNTRLIKV